MSKERAAAQMQTTEAFIDSWKRLSIEDMVALRTPDCIQAALPTATLGMPEQTNEDFAVQLKPLFGVLSNFKITIVSITNDAEAGRSVVHGKTSADSPVGPYRNEHTMILSFTEDGKKLTRIDDMMDSAFILGLQARMAEFQKKQAQT